LVADMFAHRLIARRDTEAASIFTLCAGLMLFLLLMGITLLLAFGNMSIAADG